MNVNEILCIRIQIGLHLVLCVGKVMSCQHPNTISHYQASIVRTYFSISSWLFQAILAKAVPKPMVITALPVMRQISSAKRYQPLILVCTLLKNQVARLL